MRLLCGNITRLKQYEIVVDLVGHMISVTDDLQAVLSVLDRLSAALESNRSALNDICVTADEFGGGPDLPVELIQNANLPQIKQKLEQKQLECGELRKQLEKMCDKVIDAGRMVKEIYEHDQNELLKVKKQQMLKLLEVQNEVEIAEKEKLEIAMKRAEINERVGKVYEMLRGRI